LQRGADHGVSAVLADLFPAPAEPGIRGGLPRWALILVQVAAVALGAPAMPARVGGRPAWQSVRGEDRGIYVPDALAHPWHLLQSYGGYLAWKHTASAWLRHCQHSPTGTITVTFRDWCGPARLATTFNCSSLRR
jgi:hypothetical protein